MSSKEFVQAIELILKEQSRQKAQGTAGASATAEADGGSAGKTGDHQPTQPAEGASITRLFSMLESKKMAADEP